VSTDQKGTRILARTFFQQLRASGYSQQQIIGVAAELIDLVTTDLRDSDRNATIEAVESGSKDLRQTA
jgi:hypothetical protein